MSNSDKYINQVILGFQQNKGKGSTYCFIEEVIPKLIKRVVNLFYNKRPNKQILIVVDKYATRQSIITELNKDNINYNYKILSKDYINCKYHYNYFLTIIIGVNEDDTLINHLSVESKFTLVILTKNIMNNQFIDNIRNRLPNIVANVTEDEINKDNIYSPVEERRLSITLSDESRKEYDKCTDYINTSIAVLGTIDNISKCKNGDSKLNISATEFRHQLAEENGWSENLDTTIDFQKQIDDIYNPNSILDRACNFYTITKNRRDLVTDNNAKLETILKICEENKNKRILIVSKRGEFAAKITNYINRNDTNGIICGDYHDCLDNVYLPDNNGNVIRFKSGINKGRPKSFGWQAQSSLNEKRFNDNIINTLSTKDAVDTKLKIAINVVIFTSSLCNNIFELRTRLTNVKFVGVPFITYKIYCKDTIEETNLLKSEENSFIKVIEDKNEDFVQYDENSGDIILQSN